MLEDPFNVSGDEKAKSEKEPNDGSRYPERGKEEGLEGLEGVEQKGEDNSTEQRNGNRGEKLEGDAAEGDIVDGVQDQVKRLDEGKQIEARRRTTYSTPQPPPFPLELPDEILEELPAVDKETTVDERPETSEKAGPDDATEMRQDPMLIDPPGDRGEKGLEGVEETGEGQKADEMENMEKGEKAKGSILDEVEGKGDEHSDDSNPASNVLRPVNKVDDLGGGEVKAEAPKDKEESGEGDGGVTDPAKGIANAKQKREDESEEMDLKEKKTEEKENMDGQHKKKKTSQSSILDWIQPKPKENSDAKPVQRPVARSIDNDASQPMAEAVGADLAERVEKIEEEDVVSATTSKKTSKKRKPSKTTVPNASDGTTSDRLNDGTKSQGTDSHSVAGKKDEKESPLLPKRQSRGKPEPRFMDLEEVKKAGPARKKSESSDPINRPGDFNRKLKADATYQMLRTQCAPGWRTKYKQRKRDDPDLTVEDDKVDEEVFTLSSKPVTFWDVKWANEGYKTSDYKIDYVVATEKRKRLGDGITEQVLIKYSEYALPSWQNKNEIKDKWGVDAVVDRCRGLDFVEHRLIAQLGEAGFRRDYPNRYLEWEQGEGEGGYIRNPRSLYVNTLRAVEYRWSIICSRAGLPPILIEDWTDDPEDADSLKDIQFIAYLIASPEVDRIIQGSSDCQLKELKCEAACSSCTKTRRGKGLHHCCGTQESFEISSETNEFVWKDKGKPIPLDYYVHFECTDECVCDPKTCDNRLIQNGRQRELCVFREKGKGWGVRTMSEIEHMEYVSEYCGEVCTTGLVDWKAIYNWELPYTMKGQEKPFVIVAGHMGNESRYFNHGCNANMTSMNTAIERHGLGFVHIAFRAEREILAGEELLFNYFGEETAAIKDYSNMFPKGCRCGAAKCVYPPEKAKSRDEKEVDCSGKMEEKRDEEKRRIADDSTAGTSGTASAGVKMGGNIREKKKCSDAKKESTGGSSQAAKAAGLPETREMTSSTRTGDSMSNGGERKRKTEGSSQVRPSARDPVPSTSRADENGDGSSEKTDRGDDADPTVSSPKEVKKARFEEE